jgi:hypothetical protein
MNETTTTNDNTQISPRYYFVECWRNIYVKRKSTPRSLQRGFILFLELVWNLYVPKYHIRKLKNTCGGKITPCWVGLPLDNWPDKIEYFVIRKHNQIPKKCKD